MRQAEGLYRGLFEHAPLPLLAVTPDLRIVNANDAYLSATGRRRDALAGLDMFDAFPDSPHDLAADGVRNLRASFETVLRSQQPDVMRLQRYDIQPEGRPWEVRYWQPLNWAIVDDARSAIALIHHVTEARIGVPTPTSTAVRKPHPDQLLDRADAAIREAAELRRRVHETRLLIRRQVAALKLGVTRRDR